MGRHRDDLQGLRAVAVALVVLSHAGVPWLRGGYVGVDVFFVLSGFLITGLLLREAETTGRISIVAFYRRRIRRIVPAATLTLVATLAAAYVLLDFVRATSIVSDALWSSVFAANVHFAQVGTDYFARTEPPSPLQHFWTLSVEEQFYAVWPVVLALLVLLRWRRPRLLAVVAAAGGASFAWSVVATRANPDAAYFSTLTRAWELALGAALAIALPWLEPRLGSLRRAAGWGGLVAILAAGVLFVSSTGFPGYAAALPALGAALVVAAGLPALGARPLRYVGDRSYALYLWHWPVLAIAQERAGSSLPLRTALALVAGAFVLSAVTYRVLENPIRRHEWRGAASLVGALACVVLVAAVANLVGVGAENEALAIEGPSPAAAATADVAQAVAVARRGVPVGRGLRPPIQDLQSTVYSLPCVAAEGSTIGRVCAEGRGARTLAGFGDSHLAMWSEALQAIVAGGRWRLVPFVQLGCTAARWAGGDGPHAPACRTWYRWAVAQVKALRPDVLLISAEYASDKELRDPALAEQGIWGLVAALRPYVGRVVVVEDVPGVREPPSYCLLTPGATLGSCLTTWIPSHFSTSDGLAAEAARRGYAFLRTRSWFCDGLACPTVVGDTIVYQDRDHLTNEYAAELAGRFAQSFDRALR